MSLKNKRIILGITGSIAAYKAASLARLLVKSGAEVWPVMTPSAKEFITPVTLSALTGKPVVSEFFSANDGTWHSHVDLGLWADAMVIAPATASTIGKMAHGIADNMLLTTYLSMKAPVFVAPAMDLDMFAHPSTTSNLQTLSSYGNIIIEPAEGELASHLIGKGRMEEPERIVEVLSERLSEKLSENLPLANKHILITAGPTYEKIDPVRFIGNYSSGKMGFALALGCAQLGANVSLVSGPVDLTINHARIQRFDVESANEMLEVSTKLFPNTDAAILCAAVSDYRPQNYHDTKIKRQSGQNLEIALIPNPDIAATLGKEKKEEQILIGFALETDNEQENAISKLHKKKLDFIVLNSLQDQGAGFRTDTNKITIINKEKHKTAFPLLPKNEVAYKIIEHCLIHAQSR